jgi:hypothetical protein
MIKTGFEKDLYTILGVAPHATQEEIRAAYLSRARILHPDRFNYKQQPQEWKKANDMLSELNEAYALLRNETDRAQYDDYRTGKPQSEPSPSTSQHAPSPPAADNVEIKSGYAVFDKLPENVQSRLLKRQQNKGEDQFQTKMGSVAWNYVFIVVLLSWFIYLFGNVDGERWKEESVYWYAGITFVVGTLIGRNCVTILRWRKAKLKPYFYITPLYFIRTYYDMVLFWPIWMLEDINVTHNHKNGMYQNSTVIFILDNNKHTVTLSSKGQVEAMFNCLRTFDVRLRTALANGNRKYLSDNNDFYQVPCAERRMVTLLSKGKRVFIYGISLLICGAGLLGAILANEELSRKPWNTYVAGAGNSSPETPRRAAGSSYSEQTVPISGSVQTYTMAERIAPFEIKAAQGSHYLVKLVNAYTDATVLTVFVRSGTTVTVDVPLGTYEVRYAAGQTWYGYKYLFGQDTAYSKADETFTFEVVGNQVNGYTITLYKVAHGNLTTSWISPNEF